MKYLKRGFTLVELLIVMGLLGAIAMIVIAAINPIEQTNRARDTRFKADGSQLISAIDRYFAARSEFPWVTVDDVTYTNEFSYGFVSASDEGVGICGADCTVDGVLLTSEELKTEFRNRDFIKKYSATDPSKNIYIGKSTSAAGSIYACFIPAAKSTKKNAITDGKVYRLADDGTKEETTVCDLDTAVWTGSGIADSCFVCIPE
ncbi:prepilin-type N-terminal cleavage/methylation domain-containing protein [Patescibacteria group bacterium]|nr:prepilin-type N-terminal cleavage/methylation domain-containing protein [Patescibacteria group bacterium]MBU2036275.1 prepilin-type N-terminal cleavage/methylation domain-containing protein [Patescibacteria group bacterium]